MEKNRLYNLEEININDIVILCTRCNNRVVLFQNECGACLSTEFWKGIEYKPVIRRKSFQSSCISPDPWERQHSRPILESKRSTYYYDDLRKDFFNLPKNQRSKIYKSLLNKFKNEIYLKN